MKSIKEWVERELISRPYFLLGGFLVAVAYGIVTSIIAWADFFQKMIS